MVIGDEVYELSEELYMIHPGGKKIFQFYQGSDATAAFYKIQHDKSNLVMAFASRFKIGRLQRPKCDNELDQKKWEKWEKIGWNVAQIRNAIILDYDLHEQLKNMKIMEDQEIHKIEAYKTHRRVVLQHFPVLFDFIGSVSDISTVLKDKDFRESILLPWCISLGSGDDHIAINFIETLCDNRQNVLNEIREIRESYQNVIDAQANSPEFLNQVKENHQAIISNHRNKFIPEKYLPFNETQKKFEDQFNEAYREKICTKTIKIFEIAVLAIAMTLEELIKKRSLTKFCLDSIMGLQETKIFK